MGFAELEWENPSVATNTVVCNQELEISMDIKNTGSIDTEEVVKVYLTIENEYERLPITSLFDFIRVTIDQGELRNVKLYVPYEEFSYYNSGVEKIQHHGKATITIANAAPGERSADLGAKSHEIEVIVNYIEPAGGFTSWDKSALGILTGKMYVQTINDMKIQFQKLHFSFGKMDRNQSNFANLLNEVAHKTGCCKQIIDKK